MENLDTLRAAFAESFMRPYIEEGDYFECETSHGTEYIPADVVGRTCATHIEALLNYLEGSPLDSDELCELKHGWLARLSAPGYMDCTDWTAHESEEAAIRHLIDTYGE